MKHSTRRSSSLQRCSRADSTKRGQRATTPSRLLSDLQERPAWDATSSNLDRFKLTAEEQERRRAARVSKNRPLNADTRRRSFVEAWAKHVTASVLLPGGEEAGEDTQPDQDRPRSTPPPGDLPINYSAVVDMLRHSTSATASPSPSAVAPTQPSGTVAAAPAGAAASSGAAARQPEDRRGGGGDGESAPSGTAAAAEAGDAGITSGHRQSYAIAAGSEQPSALVLSGRPSGGAGTNAALHRAEVNITPVTLRPRFNPADATTILAFGADSDGDNEAGDYTAIADPDGGPSDREEQHQQQFSPGADYGDSSSPGAPGCSSDPVAAAFEAALWGRGPAGASGQGATRAGVTGVQGGAARSPRTAWLSSAMTDAAPVESAAGDVERRLRAVEATLAGGDGGAGRTGAGGGPLLLQEDVAELRQELRKVQQDNARLRQELTAFSTHASMMLAQLQAQVQQLLRPTGGGGGPAAGPGSLPQPYSRQQPQPHHPLPTRSSATTSGAAASGPSLTRLDPYGSAAPLLSQQQQQPSASAARRNIFADIDMSALRPVGHKGQAESGVRASGHDPDLSALRPARAAATGSTPPPSSHHQHFPTHQRSGGSAAGGGGGAYGLATGSSAATAAAAPAVPSSPPIDVPLAHPFSRSGPVPPQGMPVSNIDDVEVALPSFAAFRRSAGAAAFTSARPGASSHTLPEASIPSPLATTGPHPYPHSHQAVREGAAAAASAGTSPPSSHAAAVQPRSFPTQYQPRSLGGVISRPAPLTAYPTGSIGTTTTTVPSNTHPYSGHGPALTGAAAVATTNATSGAFAAMAASAAAAAATGSDVAAVALARGHSGLPQPLVFSVGPEFRAARASGLSAENSMSLSAHTAAAAAARAKASGVAAAAGGR